MLKNNIIIGLRNIWRNKTSAFINIFGLAIGMATAVLILLWVQNELNFDKYHKNAKQTYRVLSHIKVSADEIWNWNTTPMLLLPEAEKQIPEIEQFARFKNGSRYAVFNVNNNLFKEKQYAYVDENWFQLFDYQFIEGASQDALKDLRNIVLTESKAKQLFGKQNAMGKTIRIDTLDFIVKAIIKDNPSNSSFQFDYLLPLAAHWSNPKNYENDESWGNFNYNAFIKIRQDADVTSVSDKLTTVLRDNKQADSTSYHTLQPLPTMHFDHSLMNDGFATGNETTVKVFTLIGLLILLIACINYVSLATAKAGLRTKEVSVKKIIGAGKMLLFRQFMTESVLTSFMAMILSIGLVQLGLGVFNKLTENTLQLDANNWAVWSVFGGTTLVAILLTGVYPSLLLASFQPVKLLRGFSWVAGKNANFRKGLVVMQFFISTVLIISTIIIYQQLRFIKTKDLGYQKEHIFSVIFPYNAFKDGEHRQSSMMTVKEKLQAQTSAKEVALASESIVYNGSSSSGNLDWEGKEPGFDPTVMQMSADADFQELFGLKLVEGRWFEEDNVADENNLILNEAAVKALKLKEPYIGQSLTFQGDPGQVVGIVKDFHFRSMHEAISPAVICNKPGWRSQIFIKTTGEQTAQALAATEAAWKEILPNQPFEYKFEDEAFEKLYEKDQRTASLLNIFAGIAIFISCLGLFGLATFSAERRTKEIGIRKVLGASIGDIATLLSKEFVQLVLVAFAIAAPVGWWAMDKWLQDFAYRVDIQWWMFALAGVAALLIAVFTVSFQAVRAGMSNPVEALRTE
ncbi:MAG: ABC transporter permease [Saprospiraceae bacterium]|nr:ABC transporter permease [Saprospiraceae bacterium]